MRIPDLHQIPSVFFFQPSTRIFQGAGKTWSQPELDTGAATADAELDEKIFGPGRGAGGLRAEASGSGHGW